MAEVDAQKLLAWARETKRQSDQMFGASGDDPASDRFFERLSRARTPRDVAVAVTHYAADQEYSPSVHDDPDERWTSPVSGGGAPNAREIHDVFGAGGDVPKKEVKAALGGASLAEVARLAKEEHKARVAEVSAKISGRKSKAAAEGSKDPGDQPRDDDGKWT